VRGNVRHSARLSKNVNPLHSLVFEGVIELVEMREIRGGSQGRHDRDESTKMPEACCPTSIQATMNRGRGRMQEKCPCQQAAHHRRVGLLSRLRNHASKSINETPRMLHTCALMPHGAYYSRSALGASKQALVLRTAGIQPLQHRCPEAAGFCL
jgi:hypothetical protein